MKSLLPALASAALFLAGATASKADPSPDVRPNFLFVYADDQSYEALSVVQKELGEKGRFPWLQTPNLDRMAADGVRFRNAFVVNSLCSPSRAVFLTGTYNHYNGIATNFRPFPVANLTHATLLGTAGYSTAYVGKWHMGSQRIPPGFAYTATYIGHGKYMDCPFVENGQDVPTTGWVDDVATDYAIKFISQQKNSGKPWSLVLGFKTPHGPFQPPARTKDLYAGELARGIPNLNTPAAYARKPEGVAVEPKPVPATVPINLDYFRCITAIDDCMGRLLESLNKAGFASNTVVIFTSDNGFLLGAHRSGDKRSAYEESIRVPLLVVDPSLPSSARGRTVDEMVLNLDLAQSLLDYAGVQAPKEMQGRSWRPLLTGENVPWRQSWFYEYFCENQKNTNVPDITAVRTADAKLIKYPGFPAYTELFDLKADPYEINNLINDPSAAELKEKMLAEHDRLAKEIGFHVPKFVDRPSNWGKPGSLAGDRPSP